MVTKYSKNFPIILKTQEWKKGIAYVEFIRNIIRNRIIKTAVMIENTPITRFKIYFIFLISSMTIISYGDFFECCTNAAARKKEREVKQNYCR